MENTKSFKQECKYRYLRASDRYYQYFRPIRPVLKPINANKSTWSPEFPYNESYFSIHSCVKVLNLSFLEKKN